ncbi:MAG: SDR family oxidoreductase [Methylococcaceae bacterium]|jgi:NAD(P)-dependent dehydrogenase (short-subunit alcohol dehydrogenase family)|nr:SDR family oxidoreductase [Methylococcaceae bacterium]MDD1642532.1 SDR family oxidoreductase [Methylococcaceae bacterium]
MATVLITGASRGLGLEFCKQYAAEGWQVLACCRNPETAGKLTNTPQVRVFSLDVSDFSQIDNLAAVLQDTAIDVLINNAGVYGGPHRGFGQLDYAAWTHTLTVNTQAPVKMAEAFLPHLKRGDKKLLVSISSQMGSIADNDSGGSILYRTSKAALNAAMKSIAIDLKDQRIGVLVLHPGWVKTDMGGPDALIEAQESVAGMHNVIARFTLAQSGCFLKYDGSTLPW